jgi:hypothetical protein
VKCAYLLFGKEHVKALLEEIANDVSLEDEKMLEARMGVLVVCFEMSYYMVEKRSLIMLLSFTCIYARYFSVISLAFLEVLKLV